MSSESRIFDGIIHQLFCASRDSHFEFLRKN